MAKTAAKTAMKKTMKKTMKKNMKEARKQGKKSTMKAKKGVADRKERKLRRKSGGAVLKYWKSRGVQSRQRNLEHIGKNAE